MSLRKKSASPKDGRKASVTPNPSNSLVPRSSEPQAESDVARNSDGEFTPHRAAGRVLFPAEVRKRYFGKQVSEWWVRRNVAPTRKLRLGHSTVGWFEADIIEWLLDRRGK